MPIRICILALAAGTAIAFGASAQSPASPSGEALSSNVAPTLTVRDTRFRFLDIDGDGYVRHDEVPHDDPVLRSQFASLDANGDGKLSETEYVLSHRERID